MRQVSMRRVTMEGMGEAHSPCIRRKGIGPHISGHALTNYVLNLGTESVHQSNQVRILSSDPRETHGPKCIRLHH